MMTPEQLYTAIEKTILGDSEDYVGFWLDAFRAPVKRTEEGFFRHIEPPKEMAVLPREVYASPYGEFTNWSELDGVHYSFNALKSLDLNPELKQIIDVLDTIVLKYEDDIKQPERVRFRTKKLRAYFYDALKNRLFGFYDMEAYNHTARLMIDNLKQVEHLVSLRERKVKFKTYDSIGFEAKSKEDADQIAAYVNEKVSFKMHLKFYPRFVHFVNKLAYECQDGSVFVKSLNFQISLPEIEGQKAEIAKALLKRNYQRAYILAQSTPLVEAPAEEVAYRKAHDMPILDPARFRKWYVQDLKEYFKIEGE